MGTGTRKSAADGTLTAVLANACADLTAATAGDVVGGCQAHYVGAPASTGEAAALLRAAAGLGLTVVARGSGSRLHWGAPPTGCDLIVETRRLDRVIEHAAGDLVASIQAGVRLDDLAEVLAQAGQRLALDPPPVSARGLGTIGGVIATGAAGALRFRYGSPRDLLIGITVVRADGTVAKSGGKVVKNVAGYDLGKLYAGSFGTLGLITEATFRLHPKPETATWISVECPNPATAAETVAVMADSPLAPAAVELHWPSAAAGISVSVLLEGDSVSVRSRADRMVALVSRGMTGLPSDQTKRSDGSSGHSPLAEGLATHIRVAFWAGQLALVLSCIRESASARGLDPHISGAAAAGVLDVLLADVARADAVAGFVEDLRAGLSRLAGVGGVVPSVASAVVVSAPTEVRDVVEMWGPVPSLALMRAVKDQFDPEHRMAPGRFAGGI
jgi:glycolate oxidase FAD binding subunit